MICISSIDAHSDAHSKHKMCFHWISIVEGGPYVLKTNAGF